MPTSQSPESKCAGEIDDLGDDETTIPRKYAINIIDDGNMWCFDIRTLWNWQESKHPNLNANLENFGLDPLPGLKNPFTGSVFSNENQLKIIRFADILKNPSGPRSKSQSPTEDPRKGKRNDHYWTINGIPFSNIDLFKHLKDYFVKFNEELRSQGSAELTPDNIHIHVNLFFSKIFSEDELQFTFRYIRFNYNDVHVPMSNQRYARINGSWYKIHAFKYPTKTMYLIGLEANNTVRNKIEKILYIDLQKPMKSPKSPKFSLDPE
jgi:hypothetical protein